MGEEENKEGEEEDIGIREEREKEERKKRRKGERKEKKLSGNPSNNLGKRKRNWLEKIVSGLVFLFDLV